MSDTQNRLQRLEAQYADLAAEMASRFRDHSGMIVGVLEEVNRLRTRYEAHLLVHELDALESDAAPDDSAETPAQQRYREANERHYSNREVEMAAGAFDRAEEVSQELDDWTHLIHMRLNTMSQRIASLESPAPAPDPVCTENCDGSCQKCEDAMFERMYGGGDEVPTAEPEQAPLDPVLVDEIAALIANRVLHPNEVFMTGPYRVPSEERRCKEAAQEIAYMLTNGRDGAR